MSIEKSKILLVSFTVLLPAVFTIVAIVRLLEYGVSNFVFISFIVTYLMTSIELEIGFHRYFCHGAFKTNKVIEIILGLLASTGAQGPIYYWTSVHRKHHQFTDGEGDPHSPVFPSKGLSKIKGVIHVHLGWLFTSQIKDLGINIKDLRKKMHLRIINQCYVMIVLLGLLIPTLVLVSFRSVSFSDTIDLLLWTGFVRIFCGQHIVWMINSLCHSIGSKDFKSNDNSTNLAFLSFLMWGAGWHNTHHAFPFSYKLNLKWYHIDLGGMLIYCLSKIGWAWDLKYPSSNQVNTKRI